MDENKIVEPQISGSFEWQNLRHLVDTYEDQQQVRKAHMNRARMLIRRRLLDLGYLIEKKKQEGDEEEPSWSDEEIDGAFEKAKKEKKLSKQEIGIIDGNETYSKLYKQLEVLNKKDLEKPIKAHRIWVEYLSKIKGIGYLTSARFISTLGDCSKFDTISKLWAYSGYKVENGEIQRRHKGEKANWNGRLKTTCFLLVDGFIKHRTQYRVKIYDAERLRLRTMHPEKIKVEVNGKMKTMFNDGHIHNRAIRKTAKIFLANYWLFVRGMYGLPTRMPYALEQGGHTTFMKPEEFFERE